MNPTKPLEPEARARLLASGQGWRTAYDPGACCECGSPFYRPQLIRLEPGARGEPFRWRGECCPIPPVRKDQT